MAMNLRIQLLVTLLVLLASFGVRAQDGGELEAITDEGRVVLLKEDHTWSFVETEEGDPSSSAVLSVINVQEMQDACRLELRLQNNLGFKISNLIPRFAVYNQEGILYDSASKSFVQIKPTKRKYNYIQFSGIGCYEISRIKVYDAARCKMRDIDQWNEEEGQCLSYIYVEPSELINISK
jgi:hypothetical protein